MTARTILVGTDFSDASRAALDWAVDTARTSGARVVLAHIADLPTAVAEGNSGALDSEVRRVRDRGIAVEASMSQGEPSDALLAVARTEDAGLIVVGSHRRVGMACALLGNVTEAVLRFSHVPVTVVRIPATA